MIAQRVNELIEQHGGLRAAARVLGISAPYLQRLGQGWYDKPSPKILRRMGLMRVVTYKRIGEKP